MLRRSLLAGGPAALLPQPAAAQREARDQAFDLQHRGWSRRTVSAADRLGTLLLAS
mgnify:CR=1 FL=1